MLSPVFNASTWARSLKNLPSRATAKFKVWIWGWTQVRRPPITSVNGGPPAPALLRSWGHLRSALPPAYSARTTSQQPPSLRRA